MNWSRKFFLTSLLGLSLLACNDSKTTENTNKDTSNTGDKTEKVAESPKIDEDATIRAKIMAGIEVKSEKFDSLINSPTTKAHYEDFNAKWKKLEDTRLSKIRTWQETELKKLNSEEHNLFYPFSGPDFLNAYTFFPNCDNYLMFGLEPDGKLVDLKNMPPNYLADLRNSLGEIFERNYFITSYMGRELWGKGVLPLVNIFMARTGNQIVKIERFYLDKDGKPTFFALEDEKTGAGKVKGIMVEFLNEKKTKSQKVYYFGTDVEDSKMQSKMELVSFIKSFPSKITFIKSASYILHNTNFQVMRDVVLNETSSVLQDDTGVRYSLFKELGWDVQLYGKYARPVADFGGYTFQNDLNQAFLAEKDKVKPLNFTFGYHWKTDNTSVLLCTKTANAKTTDAVEGKEKTTNAKTTDAVESKEKSTEKKK